MSSCVDDCEVLITGAGSFQVAAELLRWDPTMVAPQAQLPSIPVQTKYFSTDVALRWVDEPSSTACASPTAALDGSTATTRGGVLVVSGKHAVKEPQSAPLYVLPQSVFAAFRVVLLCADASAMTPAVLDGWHRRCVDHGFELVMHAPLQAPNKTVVRCDGGAPPSLFERIPHDAERRGLLQHDLSGSARVLQMIHNSMWVQPSAMQRVAAASGGDAVPAARPPILLVVGSDEQAAINVLTHVGVWSTAASATTSTTPATRSPPSSRRRPQLLLTHAYGTAVVDVVFLPAAIFCSSMRDMLSQWLPATVPLMILFVDGDGGGTATKTPATAVDAVLAHYRCGTRKNDRNYGDEANMSHADGNGEGPVSVWWSAGAVPMHAAERAALRMRGVEVVRGAGANGFENEDTEDENAANDTSAARQARCFQRLHELLSCAALPISKLFASEEPTTNRIMFVPLTTTAATNMMESTVASLLDCMVASGYATPSAGTQYPLTGIAITTRYYESTAELCFTGTMPPCGSRARTAAWLKQQFPVIVFVADAADAHLAGPVFLQHWGPLLDLDEDLLESERCRAVWLRQQQSPADATSGDEESAATLAFGDYPIEFVHASSSDAASVLVPESSDRRCSPDGTERVAELLCNVAWPQRTAIGTASASNSIEQQQQLVAEDLSVAAPNAHHSVGLDNAPTAYDDAAELLKANPAIVPSTAAADDDDIAAGVVWQSCEPPRWMLVDPDTLRTVDVDAIRTKNEEGLFLWMQKMKRSGHRLRRHDRHRQALFLAECLGEQCPDDVQGDEAVEELA